MTLPKKCVKQPIALEDTRKVKWDIIKRKKGYEHDIQIIKNCYSFSIAQTSLPGENDELVGTRTG